MGLTENEINIIKKIKEGNKSAFSELYKKYSNNILILAHKITGNINDAEEITQETFINALKNINKFKGNSSLYTWLYTITKNICINFLKKKKRTSFQLMEKLINNAAECKTDEKYEPMEKQYYVNQVKEGCLLGLLRCLILNQRTAFILNVLLKVKIKDTAAILNKTEGAVRVLIHRARENLKRFLCSNCTLYSKNNNCRCENLISFSLKQGWIKRFDKQNIKIQHNTTSENIEKEINDIKKIFKLYKTLPNPEPDSSIILNIKKMIKNKEFSVFT